MIQYLLNYLKVIQPLLVHIHSKFQLIPFSGLPGREMKANLLKLCILITHLLHIVGITSWPLSWFLLTTKVLHCLSYSIFRLTFKWFLQVVYPVGTPKNRTYGAVLCRHYRVTDAWKQCFFWFLYNTYFSVAHLYSLYLAAWHLITYY